MLSHEGKGNLLCEEILLKSLKVQKLIMQMNIKSYIKCYLLRIQK